MPRYLLFGFSEGVKMTKAKNDLKWRKMAVSTPLGNTNSEYLGKMLLNGVVVYRGHTRNQNRTNIAAKTWAKLMDFPFFRNFLCISLYSRRISFVKTSCLDSRKMTPKTSGKKSACFSGQWSTITRRPVLKNEKVTFWITLVMVVRQ